MDKNKFAGICKVGEKGQIVIPKEIRTMFNIKPGDSVIVLSEYCYFESRCNWKFNRQNFKRIRGRYEYHFN